jgi:hypothetical protein
MVAPPSSPSLTTTASAMMCDFLSAVHRRCIIHHWCSWAPTHSELRDEVRPPPIAIKGDNISTLISVVIAQNLEGCIQGIGRLGLVGSVWEARWVRMLVNRLRV